MSQFVPPCARALLGAMGMAIVCLILAGCASNRETPAPVTTGMMTPTGGSIKDDWVPTVTVAPAPVRTAMVHQGSARQAARGAKTVMAKASSRDMSGCGNSNACLSQLKALVDDPTHKWIGQALAPVDYASGVRLFAYRALRPKLTCQELTLGLTEIGAAATTFGRPVPGVTPENATRVRLLNSQVDNELRAERSRRCKS
jgi:hypothetical protein